VREGEWGKEIWGETVLMWVLEFVENVDAEVMEKKSRNLVVHSLFCW
jgi:hypothetical protein